MKKIPPSKYLEIIGLLFVGSLFFVWPIPHTTTIRITLIILSLFLAVYLCARQSCLSFKGLKDLQLPFILYLAFTIWIFFVALFISEKTLWSLSEINGQWFRGAMAITIGALFALLPRRSGLPIRKKVLILIFWVLVIHTLLVVLDGLYGMWLSSGAFTENLTFRTRMIGGLTNGPIEASYLIDMLILIVLVEVIFRVAYRKEFLNVNNTILAFLFCLALFGSYLTGFRNFLELSALLFLACFIIYFAKGGKKRKTLPFIVLLALILSLNIFIFNLDERWNNLWETVPLAFDTETYTAWRYDGSRDLPKLSSGKRVNISNYLRLANFKAGLLVAADNPWGIGFGRAAFRYGIEKKYGYLGASHSDSGLIDLAIGTGVVGIILWIAMLLSLIIISFKRFMAYNNYYALVLFFLCTSFAIRMIIDAVIKDHKLQLFLFVVGLLAISMIKEGEADTSQ